MTLEVKKGKSPPELIERLKQDYFSRKEVSILTGFSMKTLENLNIRDILKPDYFINGVASYYSFSSVLELFILKKLKSHSKAYSRLKQAREILIELGKNPCLVNREIVFISGNLYLSEPSNLGTLIIELSKKHEGQLNIKFLDFKNIESEVNEVGRKINNFEIRKKLAYV